MANRDKMYQVIVMGGMALVAPLAAAACGGATAPVPKEESADTGAPRGDAGAVDTGFPLELGPAPVYDSGKSLDSGFPQESSGSTYDSGFPMEGPAEYDSGFPQETATVIDSGTVDTGFPQEGPPQMTDAAFPNETAVQRDSGGHDS